MKQYLDLLKTIVSEGVSKEDRTGTGTTSIFGYQMRLNLNEGFPLLTTKKVHLRSIIYELLWFLRGETNIKYLKENGVSIWDEWADENGDLGPVYGAQWRHWKTPEGKEIDQIANLMEQLKKNPDSRRLIVSAWNVSYVDKMALPPCHYGFQINVDGEYIDLLWTQRSIDAFLGLPFNITSYAILLSIFARILGKTPRYLVGHLGNVHIYNNHKEQVKELF